MDLALEVIRLVKQTAYDADDIRNFKDHEHKRDMLDGAPLACQSRTVSLTLGSDVLQLARLQKHQYAQCYGPGKSNEDKEACGSAIAGVDTLDVLLTSLSEPEKHVEHGSEQFEACRDRKEHDLEIVIAPFHLVAIACCILGHDGEPNDCRQHNQRAPERSNNESANVCFD